MEAAELPQPLKCKVELALLKSRVPAFKKLINEEILEEQASEVLMLICKSQCYKEETRCHFASLLLKKYNAFDSAVNFPLHKAAKFGYDQLVFVLLNHPVNCAAADCKDGRGRTPVHCSVEGSSADRYREEKALLCIRQLYKKGCDLNAQDEYKVTAVHLASRKKLWQIVSFFLEKNVDIDKIIGGKSARNLIREHNSTWVPKLVATDREGGASTHFIQTYTDIEEDFKKLAIEAYKEGDKEKLRDALVAYRENLSDTLKENFETSLLRLSVDEGLLLGLQVLVDDFHVDVTEDVELGKNLTILHRAVTCENPNLDIVKFILEKAKESSADFYDWIEAVDKRGPAQKGCTALQYAAWQQLGEISEVLLDYGAKIFSENAFTGKCTFRYLSIELLQKYLDKQLILPHMPLVDEDYYLTFDFNFLRVTNPAPWTEQEAEDKDYKTVASREEVPVYLEMRGLKRLADSSTHASLLVHPVLRAFIHLKWYRLSWVFWLNFAIYATFVASVCIFICNSPSIKNDSHLLEYEIDGSFFFLITTTVLLAMREVLQMIIYRFGYMKGVENFMELVIIVITFLLLSLQYKTLAALLVLLASIELTLMIGRQHPNLAIFIQMFLIVFWTFIKCIVWYFCLIIAFGISFYIIFPFCKTGEECMQSFNTMGHSIFKAVVMMTSEYDSGSMDFDFIPVASHIIFIAFIFIVSFVMVNLLNGLAVSDTQEIRDKAQLISYKYQARIFYDFEQCLMVLTSKLSKESQKSWFDHFVLINGLLQNKSKFIGETDTEGLPEEPSLAGSSIQDVEAAPSLEHREEQPSLWQFLCCKWNEFSKAEETVYLNWQRNRTDNQVAVFINDNYRVIPDVCYYKRLRRVANCWSVFNLIVDEAMRIASASSKRLIGPKYRIPGFDINED